MAKRKNPSTSLEAYKSLDWDKIGIMYKKIHDALLEIGPATYESVSVYLNEKPERIWKRFSEMNRDGLAHRTGDRKVLSSGRQGFLWAAGPGEKERIKKTERVMRGKTVSDFSKAINQVQISIKNQESLF